MSRRHPLLAGQHVKSLHRFPVNLNFLITDFSSVDWRPFTDIQYVMNAPVEMYSWSCASAKYTSFARVYTRSRISKNNLCLPTEIQYFRGRDTVRRVQNGRSHLVYLHENIYAVLMQKERTRENTPRTLGETKYTGQNNVFKINTHKRHTNTLFNLKIINLILRARKVSKIASDKKKKYSYQRN